LKYYNNHIFINHDLYIIIVSEVKIQF